MAIDLQTPEPYSCPSDPPTTSEGYWPDDPPEPATLTVRIPFDLRGMGHVDDNLGTYHVEIAGITFAEFLVVREMVQGIIEERAAWNNSNERQPGPLSNSCSSSGEKGGRENSSGDLQTARSSR